jgi:hypothetical protein
MMCFNIKVDISVHANENSGLKLFQAKSGFFDLKLVYMNAFQKQFFFFFFEENDFAIFFYF